MSMDDLVNDVVLLFAGWLLGILTTVIERGRRSRRDQQILFGRCYRVVEEMAITLALSEAWDEAGLIRTLNQLFEDNSIAQVELPPAPPRLPDDFNEVLNRLFEYETTHPSSRLGKQLITVRNWVEVLGQIEAGLKAAAEHRPDAELPKRALSTYQTTWNDLREYLKPILAELGYRRSSYITRPVYNVSRKIRSVWGKLTGRAA
jgi:hypothetical protein